MENIKEIKQIEIDYREHALIELLKKNSNEPLSFQTENLAIGDIVCKSGNTIDFCIERKTIADLASSIKDGRHQEQMNRILECVSPNRCCYIIEGKIPEVEKPFNMPVSTIYGAIINKMFRDGVFIINTTNLSDTARFIKELTTRYLGGKLNYETKGNDIYVQTPRKKGTISVPVCFSHQLSTIPSISSVKINAIMEKFNSMREFISYLEKEDDPKKFLETLVLKNGRKLGKSSASKILEFIGFIF